MGSLVTVTLQQGFNSCSTRDNHHAKASSGSSESNPPGMRLPPRSTRSLRPHKTRSGQHTIIPQYIVMIPNYDRGTIRLSSWQNSSRWVPVDRFRIVNMEIEMLFSRWFS
jgi:hypothetical protein